ncbi:MAG: MATE family efflux transporter [Flavobacteriaceae bacterium]|nr:MATE family efflux transporter [Flavobacteriaceae bacterium]
MSVQRISFKEINRLAIPAIFAGIVEPIISLTDTAVAGRLPENADVALGAIGLVGSFLSAMIWVFLQTSNALTALVAQGYGAGKTEKLKTLVSQVFYFNLFVSSILSITFFFLAEWIMQLYGADKDLLQTAVTYFQIRVWGFPLTLLTFTIFGIFRGLQNTAWAMKISIVGGVINAVLDIILVFVFHFDVEGIAWASLIAQMTMFILALGFLYQKTPFRLQKFFPIHPQFKQTLMMSLDLFLRTLSLNIALFLAFRTATLLGGAEANQYVGAHAILIQIWLFSAFFLDGFSHAGAALSGRLLGSNQIKSLNLLVKDLIKVMFSLGILVSVLFLIFYRFFGELLTQSESVLLVFYSAFWIVALMQPINSIAFLFDGIYKGLGETKVLRNVFLSALIFGFIPFLYFFQYLDLGIRGIWFAFVIWMLIRGGGLIFHFYKKYYKPIS